jgi:hypothetical protein
MCRSRSAAVLSCGPPVRIAHARAHTREAHVDAEDAGDVLDVVRHHLLDGLLRQVRVRDVVALSRARVRGLDGERAVVVLGHLRVAGVLVVDEHLVVLVLEQLVVVVAVLQVGHGGRR